MKICLLGGSNSIIKNGLSFGLCGQDDLQLAIGASASLQNIHAITSNQSEIEGCDFIVNESNVNDIYNIYIM